MIGTVCLRDMNGNATANNSEQLNCTKALE